MIPIPTRRSIEPFLLAVAFVVLAAPRPAAAQGSFADVLTGLIIGPDSLPLAGVTVEAMSLETEIVRSAVTDRLGRYTIIFPDGGGQYRMTARRIGMVPAQAILIRYADEDQLVWNPTVASQAVRLADIEVTGSGNEDSLSGQELTAEELAELPLDAFDLSLLAMFADGALLIDPTDSTEAAFSVGGLDPSNNLVTVDGLEGSSTELPQEGIESVTVTGGSFDVANGGLGGAEIVARTRGGTNTVRGSLSYRLRDHRFAFGGNSQSPFSRGGTQNRISGGIGGPLIRNKLLANVSGTLNLTDNPLRSLSTANAQDLERLGVAPDSVSRLLGVANNFGLLTGTTYGSDQVNRSGNALLRLDYLASDRHTIRATGSWSGSNNEPSGSSQFSVSDVSGVSSRSSYSSSVGLTSQFGRQWSNELRTSYSTSRQDQDPFLLMPRANVRVTSELDDGSTGVNSLTVGGGTPSSSTSRRFQASNQLSWLPGGGHRIRVGGNVSYSRSKSQSTSNQFGTFRFNSLADFEAGAPASFSRLLTADERTTRQVSYGLYASDTWRISDALQLNYGVRFDASASPRPPQYNPALDSLFAHRTDQIPTTAFVSPSLSLTWTKRRPRQQPAFVLRGSIALNRGRGADRYISNAQRSTGLPSEEQEINCIGTGVPLADWLSYANDISTLPSACLDDTMAETDAGRAPTATVFGSEYSVPKSVRAELRLQKNLTSTIRATVTGRYTAGMDLITLTDINLNPNGGFLLSNESGRPVFVHPDSISTTAGVVTQTDSRISTMFGQVRQVSSRGASEAYQMIANLRGATGGGITLSGSYTWSRVRDRVTGIGGSTVGNPNDLEWATSSNNRTHSFNVNIGYPVTQNLELSARANFSSGSRYTPLVGNDINGDGSRNDRAFVFAPDDPTTDPNLAASLNSLLENTSGGARKCLERQLGQLASRNSCTGPWTSSLDFTINYRPVLFGLNRRLSLSIQTSNFLRGLDELLHGSENAKGWGMQNRPNSTLLFVDGFNPSTQQYQYTLNERFGVTDTRAVASRSPFQITISATYRFGTDRRQQAVDRLRGIPTPNANAGQNLTAESFRKRLTDLVLNPAAIALELKDSLGLNESQIARLTQSRDSAVARMDSLAKDVESKLPENVQENPRALAQLLRQMTTQALGAVQQDVTAVRAVLTDEQWALLPAVVRDAAENRSPEAQ